MEEIKKVIHRIGKRKFQNILIALIVVAVAILLALLVKNNEVAKMFIFQYGYAGVFLVSVISGFNVVVPIPVASFIPALLGSGLSFWPLVLVITLGMTIGDSVGYIVGRSSRTSLDPSTEPPFVEMITRIATKYRYGMFFFLLVFAGLVPLPNETVVIPASFLGLSYRQVIVPIFFGNILFNTLVGLGLASIAQAV